MNATLESSTCPRCGASLADGSHIAGLCARCFSSSALDDHSGWLASTDLDDDSSAVWPVLQGWTITGVIGAGGMGRVYRAESTQDGTAGALKVLEGKWSRDPLVAARFEAEATALKLLHHENIVRVIDTGETNDGRFCLVMELVEGCDLGRLLRAEKLSPERAVSIFLKVCDATAFAHAQGFAHRDIKPANILVGKDGMVKLADFGLAKDFGSDPGNITMIGGLTASTDHFGSAYYVAPERILGDRASGQSADIYALGVLLYHLLTGQMPLGRYTPISQLAQLPRAFDDIIGSALEADPAHRIQSVTTMQQAVVSAWASHLSGTHRIKKKRTLVTFAATFVVLMLAAIAGAMWQQRRMALPSAPVYADPASATTSAPWENSLGMKFVPVPEIGLLFSIWETRRRDAEPFIDAERGVLFGGWRASYKTPANSKAKALYMLGPNRRLVQGATWDSPGFEVTPEHPAFYFSVREAQRYCLWLTWKERGEGRLKPGQNYRLPTVREWLIACGGEDATVRPGNVAGTEVKDSRWPLDWPTLDQADAFPRLAPVGSFPPEAHGLFDLSGNVCEWAAETVEADTDPLLMTDMRLMGPAFNDGLESQLTFRHFRPIPPSPRYPNIGFRIVLDYKADAPEPDHRAEN